MELISIFQDPQKGFVAPMCLAIVIATLAAYGLRLYYLYQNKVVDK